MQVPSFWWDAGFWWDTGCRLLKSFRILKDSGWKKWLMDSGSWMYSGSIEGIQALDGIQVQGLEGFRLINKKMENGFSVTWCKCDQTCLLFYYYFIIIIIYISIFGYNWWTLLHHWQQFKSSCLTDWTVPLLICLIWFWLFWFFRLRCRA